MNFIVFADFADRHGSIFYGLEVSADVWITDDESEVKSWDVEGVRMPLKALPDGLYDFLVALAVEEWEAM